LKQCIQGCRAKFRIPEEFFEGFQVTGVSKKLEGGLAMLERSRCIAGIPPGKDVRLAEGARIP
jgi:hypothetical protein